MAFSSFHTGTGGTNGAQGGRLPPYRAASLCRPCQPLGKMPTGNLPRRRQQPSGAPYVIGTPVLPSEEDAAPQLVAVPLSVYSTLAMPATQMYRMLYSSQKYRSDEPIVSADAVGAAPAESSWRIYRGAAARKNKRATKKVQTADDRALVEELRQAGFTCEEAMLMGCSSLAELKAAGYVTGLVAAGYTCEELKAAGFTCSEAKQAGCTLMQAREAGFTCLMARAAGWTDLPKMKAAGYPLAEAMDAGWTSLAELREGGYVEGLREAGFGLTELKAAGYAPFDCKHAGFSFDEAEFAGFDFTMRAWTNEWPMFNHWDGGQSYNPPDLDD